MTDVGRGRDGVPTGTSGENVVEGEAPASLEARLQEHTRALRRDIQALKAALAEVDAAIRRSRNRVEQLRRIVPERTAMDRTGADGEGSNEDRSGRDRRLGGDRRRIDDPISTLARWVEGLPMERRTGEDRRTGERRALARDAAAEPVPATSDRSDVVSLAAFRARRERLRPSGR